MKTRSFFIIVLTLVLAMPSFSQGRKWTLLGEKLVNDRLDHDIVLVTAKQGDFKSIIIRVKGASIDFKKVTVVYGNGERDEIELRNTIPAGGTSRIIDLKGKERIIREIEFWYDANTIRGRKALVRVFGRK
ncbi:MAG: hypothetical protein JW830_08160 [Bacteroidales bacterium]|nr:hypothetical protein [Bacteroidales bacterium]